MYRITVIPGDGIGSEVMDADLTVLDAIDLEFEFTLAEAGDGVLQEVR